MKNLYKFLRWSGDSEILKSVIMEPTLRFTKVTDLNDFGNEFKFNVDIDLKDIRGCRRSFNWQRNYHEIADGDTFSEWISRMEHYKKNGGVDPIPHDIFDKPVCVSSLSKDWKIPTLWALYTDARKNGFCIEYDRKKLLNNFSGKEFLYKDISYTNNCTIWLNKGTDKNFCFEPIFRKHSSWKSEQEFRIAHIEYDNNTHNISLEDNMIKGIILGDRMPLKNKQKIIDACKSKGYTVDEIDFSSSSSYLPSRKSII